MIVTKKLQYIIAAGLIAATAAHADMVLESQNFDSDPLGAKPPSAENVIPAAPSSDYGVEVVGGITNVAGTGRGVRVFDDSTSSRIRCNWDFVESVEAQISAVRVDFTVARLNEMLSSGSYIRGGFSEFGTSDPAKYSQLRLKNSGQIDFVSGPGRNDLGNSLNATNNEVSIFANDYDAQTVTYTGPDSYEYTLQTNSVHYWLNGVKQLETLLDENATDGGASTIFTSENNLGRFGFVSSGSSAYGLDYVIDNLVITYLESVPDYIVLDGFEGQTIGSKPTAIPTLSSPDDVRPGTSTSSNITLVVGGSTNIAGTGKAVRFFDNGSNGNRMGYKVADSYAAQYSALAIEFSCGLYAVTNTDGAINIGVGEYDKNQTGSVERYFEIKLFGDNTIDFRGQSSDDDNALLASNNTVNIYVNDYDTESLSYIGPNGSANIVAANSADFWLNGVLEHSTLLYDRSTANGTVFTSTNNLGRFAFVTSSAGKCGDFILDDIKIWALDPSEVLDGYDAWVELYPGLGASFYLTDDADADGLNNLQEYVLGGDPTVDDAARVPPIGWVNMDGGSNWLNYVYNRRIDEGLTYNVFATADLSDDFTIPTEFVGASEPDNGFETATNRVSTAVEDQLFMQLQVGYDGYPVKHAVKLAATQPHPRLIFTKELETSIRNRIAEEPEMSDFFSIIKADADSLLNKPPSERIMEGTRLLKVSRTVLERVLRLAMAYRLTDEEIYLNRAEQEMLAAADFIDWNPDHWLDVAEMSTALAFGYDWLYDDLSPSTRKTLVDALVQKGVVVYKGKSGMHNWNDVCNGSMIMTSLAIAETHPIEAVKTIEIALDHLPEALGSYTKEGGHLEGPGWYWHYANLYSVPTIASMESACGADFGFKDKFSGFMQGARFYLHMHGPTRQYYNYNDAGSGGPVLCPPSFWFASQLKDPSLLYFQSEVIRDGEYRWRMDPMVLLWWPESLDVGPPQELYYQTDGITPVASHRSSWTDPDAAFIGFKGGQCTEPHHAHMDIGSFIYESDGVRWARDLGAQNYDSLRSAGIDLGDHTQEGDRWTVFRMNNFSHNTLVVNDALQRVDGVGTFTDKGPDFTVMELASLYAPYLDKASRGVRLLSGKRALIQDELKSGNEEASIRWAMLTGAEVELMGSEARLTEAGQELYLSVIEPEGATVEIFQSDPPPNDYDASNPGTRMVGFNVNLEPNESTRIVVLLDPNSGQVEELTVNPLATWQNN